ncbi:hypothetical protein phiK7A1_051c [Pseudomonas phage phiK7A1]|uniref:Uncharacterized protein n=1 Tax=Pseudomonas phage phiK7A1 TaxID=2759194 RepID=A0A7H0XFQ1_9CAUD|nr:hypothetical protein phiK7A1_051c [Pseudomonas phage phiK7A1]
MPGFLCLNPLGRPLRCSQIRLQLGLVASLHTQYTCRSVSDERHISPATRRILPHISRLSTHSSHNVLDLLTK